MMVSRLHELKVSEEPANKDNYAFVVATPTDRMSYKVIYTSANESFGYHSADEWFQFLQEWKREVEQPVQVKMTIND